MIYLILVEPENSGNVGAIARVMANFDFKHLILIDPKCNHLSKEALDRAKHAKNVLKKAKVKKQEYLKKFDCLVATTAQIGSDYNIPRSPITPKELALIIKPKTKTGIVIGREGHGLKNEEILQCDFIVTIPASRKYPTLNISHSVGVILYELFQALSEKKSSDHIVYATKKEKDQLMKMLNSTLAKLDFVTKEKKQTQVKVWKRLIGKSFLTRREAFALMGFFKKLK